MPDDTEGGKVSVAALTEAAQRAKAIRIKLDAGHEEGARRAAKQLETILRGMADYADSHS